MKKIRLEVAQRYIRWFDGELISETKDGMLIMGSYSGMPPKRWIPCVGGNTIFLEDIFHEQIAEVIEIPTDVAFLAAYTGETRKQEIPY